MAGKREKPEEIVWKLWRVEVLQGQGATIGGCTPDRREAADVLSVAQALWWDAKVLAHSAGRRRRAFHPLGRRGHHAPSRDRRTRAGL